MPMSEKSATMTARGRKVLMADIKQVIQIQGVYDGWSVLVLYDGTQLNRWADENGKALEGYERRFEATQQFINNATDGESNG